MAYSPFRTRFANSNCTISDLPLHYTHRNDPATTRPSIFSRVCCAFILTLLITLVVGTGILVFFNLPEGYVHDTEKSHSTDAYFPYYSSLKRAEWACDPENCGKHVGQLLVPEVVPLDRNGDEVPDQPITWTLPFGAPS